MEKFGKFSKVKISQNFDMADSVKVKNDVAAMWGPPHEAQLYSKSIKSKRAHDEFKRQR